MAGNTLLNALNNQNIQSMMQNSPIGQMINVLKSGGNPMAMLQGNPQLAQIMQMTNGKTPGDLGQMVNNMAQQKGIDIGQLAQSIGMPPEVAQQYGIKIG